MESIRKAGRQQECNSGSPAFIILHCVQAIRAVKVRLVTDQFHFQAVKVGLVTDQFHFRAVNVRLVTAIVDY
jgi:hypothetical protein